MTKQERSRLWAYLSFAGGIAVFLVLFIPALFVGSPVGTLVAIALMLVALLLTLWFGERGFGTSVSRNADQIGGASEPRVPLDPEHTVFDDENWLRVHGSPGSTPEHRDDVK